MIKFFKKMWVLLLCYINYYGVMYRGVFDVTCVGSDGKIKWKTRAENGVTDAGLVDILEQFFRTGTDRQPWYIGLVGTTGYTSGFVAGDTSGSHGGWVEDQTYSNSTRVAWGPVAAAAGAISNTTPAAFLINGTATIKGMFLSTLSTKGGTTGILWATALFSGGDQSVVNGDTLNVTYTVGAS